MWAFKTPHLKFPNLKLELKRELHLPLVQPQTELH